MKTQNPISAGGQNVAGYVGEIVYFADTILRKNHVWADGAPIDAEQWPELAAYAATAGWNQNEDGEYLTPDLRGRVLISASETHAVGTSGGTETVSLMGDQNGAHSHPVTAVMSNAGGGWGMIAGVVSSDWQTINQETTSSGEGAPHNNMQPYYTAKAQIRAKVDVIYASVPAVTENTAANFADGSILAVSDGKVSSLVNTGFQTLDFSPVAISELSVHYVKVRKNEFLRLLKIELYANINKDNKGNYKLGTISGLNVSEPLAFIGVMSLYNYNSHLAETVNGITCSIDVNGDVFANFGASAFYSNLVIDTIIPF